MNAKDHYDNHLAKVYAWMVGDFEQKKNEQAAFFKQCGLTPASDKTALDLGAGHGLQAIALAEAGYLVKAVDFNAPLLNELANRKGNLNIELIEDEILVFLQKNQFLVDLVVCMGDTLTHLENINQVEALVLEINKHLTPGGKVVFSFRDLTSDLHQGQRFIPVKSDDSRILTCFLEYFAGHVLVHDILYEKENDYWIQKVSAYPKLRLSEAMLVQLLQNKNFSVLSSREINRMIHLTASKTV